ncbi:GAF domain-containing protein [Lentzea atacamensis]|uniref:GAF domain-containing protein n=2 Tax=Lentzea TaxID=165301 RepID=A0A316IEU8_9PSEU|nr:GAF domain-containing protein [Lentzea atacamensis]PWK90964.1 GAF domain-containing protein [Lentzea atacamensis]RAS60365.1 GAF domain-containing protein [Lentzea atacamensis]
MAEAMDRLAEAATLEEVHRIVRTAARSSLAAHGATLVLLDGDLCYYADEDSMSPLWKGQRFPVTTCISGWAMMNRQTVAIRDIRFDPRIPQEAYRPTFVRSLLMAPILRPEPIGAIGCYWAVPHTATPAETEALESLALAAGVALERFPEGLPARGFFS